MKDYDYLSLIVEISPQHQSCFEEIEDYENVCRLNSVGDQNVCSNGIMAKTYQIHRPS